MHHQVLAAPKVPFIFSSPLHLCFLGLLLQNSFILDSRAIFFLLPFCPNQSIFHIEAMAVFFKHQVFPVLNSPKVFSFIFSFRAISKLSTMGTEFWAVWSFLVYTGTPHPLLPAHKALPALFCESVCVCVCVCVCVSVCGSHSVMSDSLWCHGL